MNFATIIKNWFFLLFGFFTLYGLLNSNYFAYSGYAVLGICLSIIFLTAKKLKTLETYFWFLISCGFSTFLIIYSNPLLTFFNFLIIIYSLSGLISSNHKISLGHFLLWPLANFFYIFSEANDNDFKLFPKVLFNKQKPKTNQEEKDPEISKKIITGSITFLVIIVFTTILSTANPYFASLISNFFNIFNFLEIWKNLSYLFDSRTYVSIVLAIIIKKTVSFLQDSSLQTELEKVTLLRYENQLQKFNQTLDLFWPKSGGALVILVFLITQIELYLATSGALKSLGISYQDRVHEVFFQLLFVSLIVLGLIFADISKKISHKFVGYILLVEAFLLTLSGLKSDIEYVSGFGLGPQRMYGFAVILFSIVAIILTFLVIQNRQDSLYFKRILASVCLIFSLINIINFDKTIIDYNNANGKDAEIQYLSADSEAWDEGYLKSLKEDSKYTGFSTESTDFEKKERVQKRQEILKNNIKYLQNKYQHLNWIEFNYSEYKQYQEVKDLNVE